MVIPPHFASERACDSACPDDGLRSRKDWRSLLQRGTNFRLEIASFGFRGFPRHAMGAAPAKRGSARNSWQLQRTSHGDAKGVLMGNELTFGMR